MAQEEQGREKGGRSKKKVKAGGKVKAEGKEAKT